MKQSLPCVLAALLLVGCNHSRSLAPDAVSRQTGRAGSWVSSATVALASGERARVRSLHVAPDVTTWVDPETGTARSVPTAEVASVQLLNRRRGALEGAGLGAVAGAVGGAALGVVAVSNGWWGSAGDFPGDAFFVIAGSTNGALIGAGAGGALGLLRGSRTVYEAPPGGR